MVLKIRATIPQSKVFFKLYAVKEEMNLFAFNNFIIGDLGFAPDQIVSFEGYDENGVCKSEYGLFDLGDGSMDKVTFSQVLAKEETEIHFVYDIRNGRYIKIVFEGEDTLIKERQCPCLLDEKGHAPDQFSTKYEDYEAVSAPGGYHPVPGDEDLEDVEDDEENDDEDEEGEEEVFDEDELTQ